MTTHALDEHHRDILRALRANAAAGHMSTVAKINEALSAARPEQANNLLRTLLVLVELCDVHLVRAVLGTPSRWLLTEDGERVVADGELVNVSPLEASLLLELDKVALATDSDPVATLQRVVREAADAGDLRTALADALTEWLYGAEYKPGDLMAKHGDAARVAEYRERFGIAAPVAAKETT